ncbi:piggyBac transposable element-derived protein 3-like [Toxorhynchites rutilus septentrionalis]|uniref:piggyBac transposable element-derived protein 3-like n=1 Tax=Toxorhynchites rutilus septentrionalis TaxID=329112 RepID=UPI002478590B|nr:piggyBac transposable element-derived protein 3-like [Toxorhynchites rutilus septentrionalis]
MFYDRDPGKPLGSKVVSNLSKDIVAEESYMYIDNFFTSLALLEDLGKRDISIIGSIRNNRIEKAPLESMKKQARGPYDVVCDTETTIVIVRWNDNNVVNMATNVKNNNIVLRGGTCKRYIKAEKKRGSVFQPHLCKMYNKGMDGVDLFDAQQGLYRCTIRNKKWYWPFFRFVLNGGVVNLWHIYRKNHGNGPLINFVRAICEGLLGDINPARIKFMQIKPKHSKSSEVSVPFLNKKFKLIPPELMISKETSKYNTMDEEHERKVEACMAGGW